LRTGETAATGAGCAATPSMNFIKKPRKPQESRSALQQFLESPMADRPLRGPAAVMGERSPILIAPSETKKAPSH
jgi:hypothetical protein